MQKLYVSMACILEETWEIWFSRLLFDAIFDAEEPPTWAEFLKIFAPEERQRALEALVSEPWASLWYEDGGRMVLLDAARRRIQDLAGTWTSEGLVPEGVKVFCLSDEAETILNEGGLEGLVNRMEVSLEMDKAGHAPVHISKLS